MKPDTAEREPSLEERAQSWLRKRHNIITADMMEHGMHFDAHAFAEEIAAFAREVLEQAAQIAEHEGTWGGTNSHAYRRACEAVALRIRRLKGEPK